MATVNNDALRCNWCKEETNRLVGVVVKLCKCNLVGYCGQAHRNADWENHKVAHQAGMNAYLRTGQAAVIAGVTLSTLAKNASDQEKVRKNDEFMAAHALREASVSSVFEAIPNGPYKQQLYIQHMIDSAAATKCEIENFRLSKQSGVTIAFLEEIFPSAKPDVQAKIRQILPGMREEVQKSEAFLAEAIEVGTRFIAAVERGEFEEAATINFESNCKKRDVVASDVAVLKTFVPILREHDPNGEITKNYEQTLKAQSNLLEKIEAHLKTCPKK